MARLLTARRPDHACPSDPNTQDDNGHGKHQTPSSRTTARPIGSLGWAAGSVTPWGEVRRPLGGVHAAALLTRVTAPVTMPAPTSASNNCLTASPDPPC